MSVGEASTRCASRCQRACMRMGVCKREEQADLVPPIGKREYVYLMSHKWNE
jgi:hypothetical protein